MINGYFVVGRVDFDIGAVVDLFNICIIIDKLERVVVIEFDYIKVNFENDIIFIMGLSRVILFKV